MKKTRKILAMAACAVLLVCISVGATVAYLTSTDEVTNTFTIGQVAITLDEAKTNADGQPVNNENTVVELKNAPRVDRNNYKLMPGHPYVKDPTVHFAAGSEASWLFIEVTNGIADIESKANDYKSIATQITDNGWTALDGVAGVYYKSVPANTGNAAVDYPVFQGFTVDGSVTGTTLEDYNGKTVKIVAYAVQADGFTTASDAWTTGLGK